MNDASGTGTSDGIPFVPLHTQYRLEGEPMEGGMGTVQRAVELETGETVAIKRMHRYIKLDRGLTERFRREIRSGGGLSHPNILRMRRVLRDKEGEYLVLDWAGRGALIDRLEKDGALPLEEVLDVARQIGAALEYAHQKGSVHRDVKPHNILVDDDGTPKLADFGLARATGDLTLTASMGSAGSPLYMSPEQLMMSRQADARSDLYSFAKTLFHLATGRQPISIKAKQIPRRLRRPIMKALQDQPDARQASVAEFVASLDRRELITPIRVGAMAAGAVVVALIVYGVASSRGWVDSIFKASGQSDPVTLPDRDLAPSGNASIDPDKSPSPGPSPTDDAAWQTDLAERLAGLRAAGVEFPEDLDPSVGADELKQRLSSGVDVAVARLVAPVTDPTDGALSTRVTTLQRLRDEIERTPLWPAGQGREWLASIDRELAWAEAVRSIHEGDPVDVYSRMVLREQVGIVPLARNGVTLLWEFWVTSTGERPQLGGPGEEPRNPGDAIILVLLAGGDVEVGAQRKDPSGANYDPNATPPEGPPRTERLPPLFVGKYELTNHQWRAISGESDPNADDGLLPACVSAVTATQVLAGLGLALPSEVEWEYACRSGSRLPWFSSDSRLYRYANVADQSARRASLGASWEAFDDGQAGVAPVGSLRSNAFGIYDMHGNVAEWCVGYGTGTNPVRGGSYLDRAVDCRSSSRRWESATTAGVVGVRVVRPVR